MTHMILIQYQYIITCNKREKKIHEFIEKKKKKKLSQIFSGKKSNETKLIQINSSV